MNTELMKAVDALGKVLAFAGSENQADWQTVLAALRDLEAENARLESAWHVETLNEKDRLIAAQEAEKDHVKSRLAAANALLREALQEVYSNIGMMAASNVTDGSIESSMAVGKRIDAHLQGTGDEA